MEEIINPFNSQSPTKKRDDALKEHNWENEETNGQVTNKYMKLLPLQDLKGRKNISKRNLMFAIATRYRIITSIGVKMWELNYPLHQNGTKSFAHKVNVLIQFRH